MGLLLPVLLPVLGGLAVFRLRAEKARSGAMLFTLAATLASTLALCFGGERTMTLLHMGRGLTLLLGVDDMTRMFLPLVAGIWLLVAVFALPYIRHEGKAQQFFGFYTVSLGALQGLGLAHNLLTFYMCYELMTLLTVPLVLHNGQPESRKAATKYLGYSVAGAALALLGCFILTRYLPVATFAPGGLLPESAHGNGGLLAAYFCMVLGFGCKAGLLPLQAWLTTAHPVAPAPASAVLSGIITKAGVLGILRVTYYVFGADFVRGTWVQTAFLWLTLATVFTGSALAYKAQLLKKRLAYSTVSQVSYILFGLLLLNGDGLRGALLQLVFHATAKDVLFLAAGAVIYRTGRLHVGELRGIGRQMPVTMWCFTFGTLSLIGIPPFGGFVSKWYLAMGALSGGYGALGVVGVVVLLVSALLTAGYLLPIVTEGFFPGADFKGKPCEAGRLMTVPMGILAGVTLLWGMFPTPFLNWLARLTQALV